MPGITIGPSPDPTTTGGTGDSTSGTGSATGGTGSATGGTGGTTGTSSSAGTAGVGTTSATVASDDAVVQGLYNQLLSDLGGSINGALTNTSNPTAPPPGEPGHVNEMLIAQFPEVALAMLKLARTLASMGYSMNQFSIKFIAATQELGKEAAELQGQLTKAQMMQTQGEIIKDCIGIGGGLATMGMGKAWESGENESFAKADGEMAAEQTANKNEMSYTENDKAGLPQGSVSVRPQSEKLDKMDDTIRGDRAEITNINRSISEKSTQIKAKDEEINNASTPGEKNKLQKERDKLHDAMTADQNRLPSLQDKLMKDQNTRTKWLDARHDELTQHNNTIQKKRDDLKSSHVQRLSGIQQHTQIYSQMMSQLGGIVGSSMTLASQAATIIPSKAQQTLQTATAPLYQNALSSSQSNAQSIQAAFDGVIQQYLGWVSARDAIRVSHS